MQDNSNFETIMSKWRRLSAAEKVEKKEFVRLSSMSGDSSDHHTLLKTKEDDPNLLVPERSTNTPLAAVSTGIAATASSDVPPDTIGITAEEKQELLKRDKEDCKEEAGDTDTKNKDNENLNYEKGTITDTNPVPKIEKNEKLGDNVDSVVLRSPPPHKTRSTASPPPEEESCGMKCLYYTLQCCDCVLM